MPLTIVVGTGRCGSTMLSRMLHMHPAVLSLSEFWNIFPQKEVSLPFHDMTGEEFWQRITVIDTDMDALAVAGIHEEENAPRGRFDPANGVPAICRVLALLTDDPDALYDSLALEVPAWPRRPMADHCRALFAALATTLGRPAVVERTGNGVSLVPVLRQQFPEAKFVFLHRNGPDTAMSMSRHATYRLGVMRMVAEAVSGSSSAESPLRREMVPAEFKSAGPEYFNGLISPPFDRERFMASPLPLAIFGWLWSWATRTGTSEIWEVPHDRWMTLRYENLLTDTRPELSRLADFMGIPAEPQWLERTCQYVERGRPGSAAARLHPSDLIELRAACAAGARAFDLLEAEHEASVSSFS